MTQAQIDPTTTVIAIDDDPDMLHMIRTFLSNPTTTIHTFHSGIDAFTNFKLSDVDCVILDMQLGDETGVDVCRVIRSMPTLKEVPIICMSGDDDKASIVAALEAGANDFIKKPFHTRELQTRIASHVRLSQQRRVLAEQNALLQKRNDEALLLNTRAVMLQEVIKQYTPRSTWEKADLAALEGMIDIPDEEIILNFLFLDLKSFTAFAEENSASQVIGVLNELFEPMTRIIDSHGGDIDKFIGDSIFAIFTDPMAAVRSAWEIQLSLAQVNARRLERGVTELAARIGLNRGTVIRGNVGGESRKENTLIGDAVNVASRIERACQPGLVLMSDSVYEQVKDQVEVGTRKLLKARGKTEMLPVYYLKSVPS